MASVTVRRVREDEWPALRSVRLAALADAPGAFSSTLAEESTFDDAIWRERARRGASGSSSATFVAEGTTGGGAGRPLAPVPVDLVGLLGGMLSADGAEVDLFSMWVAPAWRRQGVARHLLEAVARWSEASGASTVALWVAAGNEAALSCYERCGFTRTGLEGPLPNHPQESQVRLSRTR
jgi:ribosomal protein S18 acetylase RimI-like enzyme